MKFPGAIAVENNLPPAKTIELERRLALRNRLLMVITVIIGVIVVVGALYAFTRKTKPLPPPIVEAEGVVTLDGAPLKKVRVRFIPVGDYGPEYYAIGTTDDSGRFTLTCNGQPGACACENVVVVEESEVPEEYRGESNREKKIKYYKDLGGRPLPKRYANLAESEMKVIVTPDRKNYNIPLNKDKEIE